MTTLVLSLNNSEVLQSDKQSLITCFEDLSNEIFYEIFDYLDTCNAYEAFYHLNNRFQYFFLQLSLPCKINLDLMFKTNFEQRYQYIITPNIYRIISLRLSNCICIDSFCFDSSFLRLESLILNEIKSEKVESLLMNLTLIPRLFSLSMTTIGIIKDPNTVHRLIFGLPVLKYCNTTFQWWNENFSLSNCINENSCIEYFVSKSAYNTREVSILLSYMPRLVHLSCSEYSSSSQYSDIWRSITLNNLTHFSLDNSISFVEFEMFMSNFFHQLEVLRITSRYNNDYLDSKRWERLILNHLPCLQTFDLQHFGKILPDDEYYLLIDGFISPFWIERKWFFNHQCYRYNNTLWIFFYSVKQTYTSEQIDFNFVRHIVIENNKTTIDLCSSQLTLSSRDGSIPTLFINELNRIIPFEQVKKLIVTSNNFNMNQLMELLYLCPNIHVLILSTYSSSFNSLQNKTNNNIQQIIIHKHLTFNDVQQLINRYPRLKSLEMKIKEDDLELIIRFILKHNINQNSLLHLLAFQDAHSVMINRLQKVIHREELLQTYSIQYISDTAYLWW